jgi:hypothetical protein
MKKKDADKNFRLRVPSRKENISVDLDLKKMKEVPTKVNKYERPRYAETAQNKTHQADVMFIPEDRQLPGQPTAALIVSDVASKKLDVRFLKEKTAAETKKAIQQIYNSNHIDKPEYRLITDAGAEFKGQFKNYVENELNTKLATKTAGKSIGHIDAQISKVKEKFYDAQDEFEQNKRRSKVKGEKSRGSFLFRKEMEDIVDEINSDYKKRESEGKIRKPRFATQKDVIATDDVNDHLLQVGDIVKRKLYKTENRNVGKFRKGDRRWTMEDYKIVNIFLTPGSPPMYELQEVDKDGKVIGKPDSDNPVHYKHVKLSSYFQENY